MELSVVGADPQMLTTASATLTLQVGLVLIVGWALRLGFVANFISDPVLTGFKAGMARSRAAGRAVWLVGLNAPVLEAVRRSPLGEVLGRDQLHYTLELAVQRFEAPAS